MVLHRRNVLVNFIDVNEVKREVLKKLKCKTVISTYLRTEIDILKNLK